MTDPRIRVDAAQDCTCGHRHPHLDEFVAHGVDVHFEALGGCQWWIGVTDPASGRRWAINCGAESIRARGFAIIEEVS